MDKKLISLFLNDQEIKYNPDATDSHSMFPEKDPKQMDQELHKIIRKVKKDNVFCAPDIIMELVKQGQFEAVLLMAIDGLQARFSQKYESID